MILHLSFYYTLRKSNSLFFNAKKFNLENQC
jgi:hypothetical protein